MQSVLTMLIVINNLSSVDIYIKSDFWLCYWFLSRNDGA